VLAKQTKSKKVKKENMDKVLNKKCDRKKGKGNRSEYASINP
jgi:hypothetical protein